MDTRLAGMFLVAAAIAACSKSSESSSAVVAKVGDDVITAEYVKERLDETSAESKDAIRQRMARERRSRDYDEWVKKLREGTAVSINDAELDKVQADATPAQLSGQPVAAPPAQTAPPTSSKIGGN
jgi:hypothetical protein